MKAIWWMVLTLAFGVVILGVTVGVATAQRAQEQAAAAEVAITPDNAAAMRIEALEGIVEARELVLEREKRLAANGRHPEHALAESTIKLWQAKNNLARAQNRKADLIQGLREIIQLRESQWRDAQLFLESGREGMSSYDIADAQALVLQARVDLCEVMMGVDE